jgi:hypothetical protein
MGTKTSNQIDVFGYVRYKIVSHRLNQRGAYWSVMSYTNNGKRIGTAANNFESEVAADDWINGKINECEQASERKYVKKSNEQMLIEVGY